MITAVELAVAAAIVYLVAPFLIRLILSFIVAATNEWGELFTWLAGQDEQPEQAPIAPSVRCPACGWVCADRDVAGWRRGLRCMNGAAPDCDAELEYIGFGND